MLLKLYFTKKRHLAATLRENNLYNPTSNRKPAYIYLKKPIKIRSVKFFKLYCSALPGYQYYWRTKYDATSTRKPASIYLTKTGLTPKLLPVVKIFASKMSISRSWPNFKNSILNCQNGNIKCSSSQIKDQNVTFGIFLLIKTISYRVKKGVNLMHNQPLRDVE